MTAVKTSNLNMFKGMLQTVDINAHDIATPCNTALHHAASKSLQTIAICLLGRGADINIKNVRVDMHACV
jgi:ankyrin repeat protein